MKASIFNSKGSILIILFLLPQISWGAIFEVSKLDFAKFTGLSPVEAGKCFNEIRVIGDIVDGDNKRFNNSMEELIRRNSSIGCQKTRSDNISVSLSSKGGSISEAIKVGRSIREKELSTKIYKNDICASACVLIFGAGVNSFTDSTISKSKKIIN